MKGPGFWKHGGAWGGGSLHKRHTGSSRGPAAPFKDCPECGGQVCFTECVRCKNFQVWHEDDDGMRRCYHEYMDLESRGYYDGTWNDQPGQYTYEEWKQYQEELRRNEVIDSGEMEREWAEFEREAEDQEEEGDSDYDEYLKGEYGEYEDEGDHEDEEEDNEDKKKGDDADEEEVENEEDDEDEEDND